MKVIQNIASIFPKHLFWDMDSSKLSINRDKDIIIPRALYATTQDSFDSDITKLEQLYSTSNILYILQNTKENISNEVCLLISKRYNSKPFLRSAV